MMEDLNEVCGNCGLTLGSHSSGTKPYPPDSCPATEHGMDFAQGPGTVFKPTGKFKEYLSEKI